MIKMTMITFAILSFKLLSAIECDIDEPLTLAEEVVKCEDAQACADCGLMTLTDISLLNCASTESCLNINAEITAAEDFLLECTGASACAGGTVTITCEGETIKGIKCGNDASCDGTTFIIDGGTEGCVLEKIECGGAVSCNGASFELINVDVTSDEPFVCSGGFDESCAGLECSSTTVDVCPIGSISPPTSSNVTASSNVTTTPPITTSSITEMSVNVSITPASNTDIDDDDEDDDDDDDDDEDSDSSSLVNAADTYNIGELTAAEAVTSVWAIAGYAVLAIIICVVCCLFVLPRCKRSREGLHKVETKEEQDFMDTRGDALPAIEGVDDDDDDNTGFTQYNL